MAYKISSTCIRCRACLVTCPTGAIAIEGGDYWINPALCNDCEGFAPEPLCASICPADAPLPLQTKKGRTKAIENRFAISPSLFANGKSAPFSSAIIVWEACNLLSQHKSLPWILNEEGDIVYKRQVNQGQGEIILRLANVPDPSSHPFHKDTQPTFTEDLLDLRATCMHLIYAAHATALEKPWEQEFTISDRQIEEYLGLDKRKDLSKSTKLNLIKMLAQQPCWITAEINWPQQGKVKAFSIPEAPLWRLLEIVHHFYEDEDGSKHLVGLTLKVQAGIWAKYFLNKKGCQNREAFYQYGYLPKSLLRSVMGIWQQHEGAARMLLWLLFKNRIGEKQRITVPTLMRVAYGEERVKQAASQRDERKRILRMFENDLDVVSRCGLKPIFDPVTYPSEIQPLWAKLECVPDNAEEALDFWIQDGSESSRLTDSGPRGKWQMLMNARILEFERRRDWEQTNVSDRKNQKEKRCSKTNQKFTRKKETERNAILSGEQIATLRKQLQISQRDLAEKIGKSQSWIRDVENGRFQVKSDTQALLRRVLGVET